LYFHRQDAALLAFLPISLAGRRTLGFKGAGFDLADI
jgi:hypothetical protein